MARPSKLDRLGPEIYDEVKRLRERGRTIDEIMTHLRTLDVAPAEMPSRSGLARDIQPIDVMLGVMRKSRIEAERLVKRDAEEPEGRQGRANVEMVQALLMNVMIGAVGNVDVTITPKDAAYLAKAVADGARAERLAMETKRAIKREMSEDAERELAKAQAEAATTGTTLTPEAMVARIRALYSGEG